MTGTMDTACMKAWMLPAGTASNPEICTDASQGTSSQVEKSGQSVLVEGTPRYRHTFQTLQKSTRDMCSTLSTGPPCNKPLFKGAYREVSVYLCLHLATLSQIALRRVDGGRVGIVRPFAETPVQLRVLEGRLRPPPTAAADPQTVTDLLGRHVGAVVA